MTTPPTLRILPSAVPAGLGDLVAELETLLPLKMATDDRGSGTLAGSVVFGANPAHPDPPGDDGEPVLLFVDGDSGVPGPTTLTFTDSGLLDPRLRNAGFPMEATRFTPVEVGPGDEILALARGLPVWVKRNAGGRHIDIAGIRPDADIHGSPYGAVSERIAGMVPLIHFAREWAGYRDMITPPIRACFVIDDPSLMLPTYGYVRFRQLASHAESSGFHVAIGMTPLSSALTSPAMIRLFRESPDLLSVAIHGNNHSRREFAAHGDLPLKRVAQAIRRIDRMERRTGISIDRVAIPPHGGISEDTVEAAGMLGLHGMTTSPSALIEGDYPPEKLIGLSPAAVSPWGLPILLRRHIRRESGWLPLHAFLDQPMIVYLHHQDLAEGVEASLGAMADRVRGIGPVLWCSLEDMARSNYLARIDGGTAHVTPFADRVAFPVPEHVQQVVVHPNSSELPDAVAVTDTTGVQRAAVGEPVEVTPGAELRVVMQRGLIDPDEVPSPGWQPWPIVKKVMTELRDRLRPLTRR